MIDLLIAILVALKTGTACDLGQTIPDWYAYGDKNPALERVDTFEFGQAGIDDAWLYYNGDDDTYVLFVFRERVSDVIGQGRSDPHGRCAVVLDT